MTSVEYHASIRKNGSLRAEAPGMDPVALSLDLRHRVIRD